MVAEYKAERRSCKHPKLRSSAAHAAGVLRSDVDEVIQSGSTERYTELIRQDFSR
ncbi:hypothetical protein [Erwinia tracheiphila]|uniref:hypothetical protein n=1 Tax=Erwinia tracheiphila TaxID=65700 RepID=UPI00398ADB97